MSLDDDIAKLPPRNTVQWLEYLRAEPRQEPYLSIAAAWEADLARLRLAREWIIAHQHEEWCELYKNEIDQFLICRCGRDALLAAMEEPT